MKDGRSWIPLYSCDLLGTRCTQSFSSCFTVAHEQRPGNPFLFSRKLDEREKPRYKQLSLSQTCETYCLHSATHFLDGMWLASAMQMFLMQRPFLTYLFSYSFTTTIAQTHLTIFKTLATTSYRITTPLVLLFLIPCWQDCHNRRKHIEFSDH